MHTLMHLGMLAGTVLLLAKLMPGVRVKGGWSAVAVALVFSVVNWATGWLVKTLLVVPVLLTFGLLVPFVTFIVNVVVLWLTDKIVETFELRDGKTLLISAGAITVANGIFQVVLR